MMQRCSECQKSLVGCLELFSQWYAVMITIDMLETEEAITPATAELLREHMMQIKRVVDDGDEAAEAAGGE